MPQFPCVSDWTVSLLVFCGSHSTCIPAGDCLHDSIPGLGVTGISFTLQRRKQPTQVKAFAQSHTTGNGRKDSILQCHPSPAVSLCQCFPATATLVGPWGSLRGRAFCRTAHDVHAQRLSAVVASQRPVRIPVPSEEARVPGKLEKRPAPAQSRGQRPGDPGVALSHVPPAPFSGGGAPLTPVPGEGPHLPLLADAWVSPACRCVFFPPLIINDPVEDFTASQNPGPSCRDFCRQVSVSGGLTLAGGHFTATWYKTDEHIDVGSLLQARPA